MISNMKIKGGPDIRALLIAAMLIIVISYVGVKNNPTISQGIYGKTYLITGDCMPIYTEDSCRKEIVSRTIFIRELVPIEAIEKGYLKKESDLIKVAKSNIRGFYEVWLPPGNYSVFIEDEGKEYCRWVSGSGGACQITIGDGLYERDITINHATW
jgi:hypothetical protein